MTLQNGIARIKATLSEGVACDLKSCRRVESFDAFCNSFLHREGNCFFTTFMTMETLEAFTNRYESDYLHSYIPPHERRRIRANSRMNQVLGEVLFGREVPGVKKGYRRTLFLDLPIETGDLTAAKSRYLCIILADYAFFSSYSKNREVERVKNLPFNENNLLELRSRSQKELSLVIHGSPYITFVLPSFILTGRETEVRTQVTEL